MVKKLVMVLGELKSTTVEQSLGRRCCRLESEMGGGVGTHTQKKGGGDGRESGAVVEK